MTYDSTASRTNVGGRPSGPSARRLEWVLPVLRTLPIFRGRWRLASLLLLGDLGGGRTLEERVTPHLADSVLQTRAGVTVRLQPDSHFLSPFLFGDYDAAAWRILRRLLGRGDVVVDAGANIGWYTALFARTVGPEGRVIGFEPLPRFAACARETIALNGVAVNAELHECGLGREPGSFVVNTFVGLPGGHASVSDLGRSDAEPHECQVTSLDRFVASQELDRVHLMKVDVEGYEREVFQGAAALLGRSDGPIVHFEINHRCLAARGLSVEDVQEPLRAAGYQALWQINPHGGATRVTHPDDTNDSDYVTAKGAAITRVQRALASSWQRRARAPRGTSRSGHRTGAPNRGCTGCRRS